MRRWWPVLMLLLIAQLNRAPELSHDSESKSEETTALPPPGQFQRNGVLPNLNNGSAGAWLRALCFCLGVASLLGLIWLIAEVTPLDKDLWAVGNLDIIVTTSVVLSFGAGILLSFEAVVLRLPFFQSVRRGVFRWGGAAVLVVTVLVTYASFRNQARLSAEAALSESGYDLYALEMEHLHLRCLYFNYGHSASNKCLNTIVKDSKNWSSTMFYVEEVWFTLDQAQSERKEWGSSYAEQIKYWSSDVSRDPTGIFSYYLISSSSSITQAKKTMMDANVKTLSACKNFRKVWSALDPINRPEKVSQAGKTCAEIPPIDQNILTRPTLEIADE